MQNSVEYLQGRKFSTLQAQRWLSGRIWVTGLNSSTSQYGRKKFSDESGKAIKGVLLCSRTLLSSIFCCLLLHNFSLFVSFIKFFTEILFVQIYPLTTWTASLSILPLSITLRRFTSSLICHLARISYNVSTASNVHFALILQLISFVRWTYTSDFGPSS